MEILFSKIGDIVSFVSMVWKYCMHQKSKRWRKEAQKSILMIKAKTKLIHKSLQKLEITAMKAKSREFQSNG